MTKDRVGAFIDAVLAIIITILVLNLKTPELVDFSGFWALREEYIAYIVSFFWVGTIWASQIIGWSRFDKIDRRTILWVLVMLFFISLFPYSTSIVADHLHDTFAEVVYGLLTLAITTSNVMISRNVNRCNGKKIFGPLYVYPKYMVYAVFILKIVGLVMAFVWAPAMMLALTANIVLSLIYLATRKEVIGETSKGTTTYHSISCNVNNPKDCETVYNDL